MIDFSIIIPSYNKANFISETIDSVINQSFSNWELIIVDDGSTDNSITIIEEYCAQNSKIQLYKRQSLPKGGSACRNIGLSKAKGHFILFLDADDLLKSNCLEKRLLKIKDFNTSNLWVFSIGTFYKVIGDSNSIWSPDGSNFLIQFLKHNLPWHTMSVIWQIDFLKKLNGFDPQYARLQDVELHTRALLDSDIKLKTFPNTKIDAFYRIDEKRTSQNIVQQIERQKQGVFMYMEKISAKLGDKKQYRAIKGTLFSFITTLNYRCLVEGDFNQCYEKLKKEIFQFMSVQSRLTSFDILYIRIYMFLYQLGFWRVKGFNYLFKTFF